MQTDVQHYLDSWKDSEVPDAHCLALSEKPGCTGCTGVAGVTEVIGANRVERSSCWHIGANCPFFAGRERYVPKKKAQP